MTLCCVGGLLARAMPLVEHGPPYINPARRSATAFFIMRGSATTFTPCTSLVLHQRHHCNLCLRLFHKYPFQFSYIYACNSAFQMYVFMSIRSSKFEQLIKFYMLHYYVLCVPKSSKKLLFYVLTNISCKEYYNVFLITGLC